MGQPLVTHTSRRLHRLQAVVLATLAALAAWTLSTLVLGIELEAGWPPRGVNVGSVAVVSAGAAAAGWAFLAVLERFIVRARTTWTVVAVVVAVLSLSGPLTAPAITDEGRIVLAAIHVLVGAVVITMLRRTSLEPR